MHFPYLLGTKMIDYLEKINAWNNWINLAKQTNPSGSRMNDFLFYSWNQIEK